MQTCLFSLRVLEGHSLPITIWSRPGAGILALALILFSLPTRAHAQTDDFADGNDTGWSHYDPLGAAAALAGQGPKASYTFPAGGYRIQAQPFTALGNLGPARAASFRHDASYSKFYMAADLVNWDNTLDQAFGFLAR